MKNYNNLGEQVDLLKLVLSQQSESLKTKPFRKWLQAWITSNVPGARLFVNDGNLYVTKGKADPYYPCIVSHIDTVHDINPTASVIHHEEYLFSWCSKTKRSYGIGGDDKVGVFICLMALIEQPAVKCAFFRDEEIGCLGSSNAKKEWFDNCAFVLQCDRRGNADFINDINGMKMYSKEFGEAIAETLSSFGYKEKEGMMTDVEAIKKAGVNLCMANMSCGYYEPHTNSEYVVISEVLNCLSLVMTICSEQYRKQWYHKAEYTYTGTDWDRLYAIKDGVWQYKDKKKRWSPADVKWDINGKFWYLSEIINKADTKKNLAGTGKFDDPYRLASKDKVWELEQKYSHALPDKKKTPELITNGRCPSCSSVNSYWDDYASDWFCFACGNYHSELAIIAARGSAKYEHKIAKTTALFDIAADDDGLLPSTKMIQQATKMLNDGEKRRPN